MKFTFVSFAALSMTATQAAKLNKQFSLPDAHLAAQAEGQKPMSYSNIMESVKSLEKAYEFHRNEEKLLNEINSELKEYWNLSEMSHKMNQDQQEGAESQVSSKMTHKQESKGKAKAKAKTEVKVKSEDKAPETPKSTPSVEENAQVKKPKDSSNTELEENVQLEDINFIELSEDNEDSLLNDDPSILAKELQQLKQSSKMHHKMKHHAKAHAKNKQHQKMKSKMKEHNQALTKIKQKEDLKAKEDAELKAQIDAAVKAKQQEFQKQREQLLAKKKAIADAETNIQMKIQAAQESAETAEILAKEAEAEVQKLIKHMKDHYYVEISDSKLGQISEENKENFDYDQLKSLNKMANKAISTLKQHVEVEETNLTQAEAEWDWNKVGNWWKQSALKQRLHNTWDAFRKNPQ